MSAGANNKTKRNNNLNKVVVSSEVKDFSNDPFFVKKAKDAEAFIKKYGLPPSSS
jgi:hypothetical protein